MGFPRFLKVEESDGTELGLPVEAEAKAGDIPVLNQVADNTLVHGDLQSVLDFEFAPDTSIKPTYSAGEIDFIEFYKGATQTTSNRIAKADVTFTGDDPTSEAWEFFDTDGTTVLKTVTLTHTWVSDDLTKTVSVTA